MDEKYHLYAIQAILEEFKKPKRQRMLSDEELEKMLQIELEALKEHDKANISQMVGDECARKGFRD